MPTLYLLVFLSNSLHQAADDLRVITLNSLLKGGTVELEKKTSSVFRYTFMPVSE